MKFLDSTCCDLLVQKLFAPFDTVSKTPVLNIRSLPFKGKDYAVVGILILSSSSPDSFDIPPHLSFSPLSYPTSCPPHAIISEKRETQRRPGLFLLCIHVQ